MTIPMVRPGGGRAKGSRGGTAADRACKRTAYIAVSCTERPIRILAVIARGKNPTKGWRRSTCPRCGSLKISVSDGFRTHRLRVRTQDPVSQGRDTEAELGIGCSMQHQKHYNLDAFSNGAVIA